MTTRVGEVRDAELIARTMRAFNAEYDDPAPDQAWLAARVSELLARDTAVVLLEATPTGAAEGVADGFTLARLRPSLWSDALEAYLAEVYVRPDLRGRGLGRRLMEATLAHLAERGATYVDLTTTNADEAAVALYESLGFDRHERRGPDVVSYYFERDLP